MQDGLDPNLRLLAPAAVAVFAVAFVIILLSSGALFGGGSTQTAGSGSEERRSERAGRSERRDSRERGPQRATYTVQAGDTLASIASENGVSVERIQELNPQLDPQALTAGQKIKLRE